MTVTLPMAGLRYGIVVAAVSVAIGNRIIAAILKFALVVIAAAVAVGMHTCIVVPVLTITSGKFGVAAVVIALHDITLQRIIVLHVSVFHLHVISIILRRRAAHVIGIGLLLVVAPDLIHLQVGRMLMFQICHQIYLHAMFSRRSLLSLHTNLQFQALWWIAASVFMSPANYVNVFSVVNMLILPSCCPIIPYPQYTPNSSCC